MHAGDPMKTLFLLLALAQLPADNSTDRTHKPKHAHTPFYAAGAGAKTATPCGWLREMKSGQWRGHLSGGRISPPYSPAFDTRTEAAAWLTIYCPVEGVTVTK